MSRRKIKKHILLLLENRKLQEIVPLLSQYNDNEVISPLFSALCSPIEMSKWHAVSCFGFVVSRIAERDMESARIIMRRFLWSLNDESGGIGWGAPESMAEIMAQNDMLFSEYIHMLISYMREDGPEILQDGNYLELPALQQGLLWGIGRLLLKKPQEMLVRGVTENLKLYLRSPDKIVQGLAAWCLGMCNQKELIDDLLLKTEVVSTFNLYMGGILTEVSVAELALCSIKQLEEGKCDCPYFS
jgi:hypothetical protein